MKTIKFLIALLAIYSCAKQSAAQTRYRTTVYFAFDSYKLLPAEIAKIDSILLFKDSLQNFTIGVWGHTDNVGSVAYNEILALKRASSVKSYLVKKGITDSLIIVKSYGKNQPVANNSSLLERKLNRRAEVIITGDQGLTAASDTATKQPLISLPTDSIIRRSLPNGVIVEGSFKWITANEILLSGTGNLPLIRNTKDLLLNQLNTMKADLSPMTSNVVMCIPGATDCELTKPVTFYMLVQENTCLGEGSKVYKQVKDAVSNIMFWQPVNESEFETLDGKKYFKYTTYNLCPPCINFACEVTEWDSVMVRVKPRKYKVGDFKVIFETSNAVIIAEAKENNMFLIKNLKFDNEKPQVIVRLGKGKKKEFINKQLASFKYSTKKKAYIIRKKDMR